MKLNSDQLNKLDGITKLYVDYENIKESSGILIKPTYTYITGNQIGISQGTYVMYSDDKFTYPLTEFTISGKTFSLTDNSINYIVAINDNGYAYLDCITNRASITQSDVIPIYTIYLENNSIIHILDWDRMAKGLSNKLTDK